MNRSHRRCGKRNDQKEGKEEFDTKKFHIQILKSQPETGNGRSTAISEERKRCANQ
jgi:hypothetical protein